MCILGIHRAVAPAVPLSNKMLQLRCTGAVAASVQCELCHEVHGTTTGPGSVVLVMVYSCCTPVLTWGSCWSSCRGSCHDPAAP